MVHKSSKSLFTDKAKAYAEYRPSYPKEAVDQIIQPFDGMKDVKAIDVGAGTGIASRLLADRGIKVVAAEPNKSMIQAAFTHKNITWREMEAEHLQTATSSVDLVSAFQAFHWFNFKQSLQEFNRILKPTGRLALVWNYWDTEDPFTAKYARLIDEAAQKNSDRITPYDDFPSGFLKKYRIKLLWKMHYLPYFKNIQRHRYTFVRDVDFEALKGSAYSQSYIKHEGPAWDTLIQKIRQLYQKSFEARLVYAINLFTARPRK